MNWEYSHPTAEHLPLSLNAKTFATFNWMIFILSLQKDEIDALFIHKFLVYYSDKSHKDLVPSKEIKNAYFVS